MSAAELLSFIPLLLYGLALSDLFGQWRRFFDKNYRYWPYVLTTVMLTEIAIWNIYLFLMETRDIELLSYYQYWSFLIQPIFFLMVINAFTPDTEIKNTEEYFKNRITVVFTLLAIYIALHLLPGASSIEYMQWPRIASIVICLVIAFTKYIPVIYIFGIIWLLSMFFR